MENEPTEFFIHAYIPVYSYGFGLEECRERDLAEEVTRKSLTLDKRNAFATHALSELTKAAQI